MIKIWLTIIAWAKAIKFTPGEILTISLSVPAAIVASYQAVSVDSQRREAEAKLADTKRLMEIAEKHAESAKIQAEYIRKISQATEGHLNVAKDERDAAWRVARAGEDQVDASIKALQLQREIATEADRPKIVISEFKLQKLAIGEKPKMQFVLRNHGSSPATDLYLGSRFRFFENNYNPDMPPCDEIPKAQSYVVNDNRTLESERSSVWTEAEDRQLRTAYEELGFDVVACYKGPSGKVYRTTNCISIEDSKGSEKWYTCQMGDVFE